MRRNLTGIFIFDKLEGDEKREPTCFEDCNESTQIEWLESLSRELLIELSKKLGSTIKDIGEQLDLMKE